MRILIAEDDRTQALKLGELLAEEGFEVIYAENGSEALSLLRKSLPDALILDMVLPRLDGAAVLDAMPGLLLEKKPLIVAIVPMRIPFMAAQAKERGASLILEKPYASQRIIEFLREPPQNAFSPAARKRIEAILTGLGVRPYTKGCLYLTEAIGMAADNFSLLDKIGDGLYTPIAARYNVRPANVERLIRYAIEAATIRGRLEAYHRLFGYTLRRETGKPTNAEFIAIIAENIRRGGDEEEEEAEERQGPPAANFLKKV